MPNAEVAYLLHQLPAGSTLYFTNRWRKRLARRGSMSAGRLAEVDTFARAGTIRQGGKASQLA